MTVHSVARRWAGYAGCVFVIAVAVAPMRAPLVAQGRPQSPSESARRDTLEQRVRLRMGLMLRTQLGLTDEQLRRLQATNRRFETQRVGLFNEERAVRAEIRELLEEGDTTQYPRVGTLLDRAIQVQRQRIDLEEAEQRELATFLNPGQRARLYGIEEQLRRRMEGMRPGPSGGRMDPPPMRPGGRPGAAGGRRPLERHR